MTTFAGRTSTTPEVGTANTGWLRFAADVLEAYRGIRGGTELRPETLERLGISREQAAFMATHSRRLSES
jgi:hypothetical protein